MPADASAAPVPSRWSLASYLEQKQKLQDQDMRYRLFLESAQSRKPKLECEAQLGRGTQAPQLNTRRYAQGTVWLNGFVGAATGWRLPNVTPGVWFDADDLQEQRNSPGAQAWGQRAWGGALRIFALSQNDSGLWAQYRMARVSGAPVPIRYRAVDLNMRVYLVNALSVNASWSPRAFLAQFDPLLSSLSRVSYSYGARLHFMMFFLGFSYAKNYFNGQIKPEYSSALDLSHHQEQRTLWVGFSI